MGGGVSRSATIEKSLAPDSFATLLRDAGCRWPRPRVDALFAVFDEDGDGLIDPREFSSTVGHLSDVASGRVAARTPLAGIDAVRVPSGKNPASAAGASATRDAAYRSNSRDMVRSWRKRSLRHRQRGASDQAPPQ